MSFISKEVRSFVVIASTLSIRAAADKLHVSPSALSRQLRIVEEQLGHALFLRQPGGLVLTEQGRYFFENVSQLIAQESQILANIDTINQGEVREQISIGIAECINTEGFIQMLNAIIDDEQQCFIQLRVETTEVLVRDLLKQNFDFVISFNTPKDSRIQFLHQFNWATGLVCSPDHRLAQQPSITLDEVLGEPIALVDASLSFYDRVEHAISRRRKLANVTMRSNSVTVIKRLVESGSCVTLLSELDVVDEVKAGKLKFISLRDDPLGETVEVAVHQGAQLTPVVKQAIERATRFLNHYVAPF